MNRYIHPDSLLHFDGDEIFSPRFLVRPGIKVFTVSHEGHIHERTIGQVRVTITDSSGLESEDIIFDNYKPKRSLSVEIMCVETGVDTGSVFDLGRNAFFSIGHATQHLASLYQHEHTLRMNHRQAVRDFSSSWRNQLEDACRHQLDELLKEDS